MSCLEPATAQLRRGVSLQALKRRQSVTESEGTLSQRDETYGEVQPHASLDTQVHTLVQLLNRLIKVVIRNPSKGRIILLTTHPFHISIPTFMPTVQGHSHLEPRQPLSFEPDMHQVLHDLVLQPAHPGRSV